MIFSSQITQYLGVKKSYKNKEIVRNRSQELELPTFQNKVQNK